MYVLGGAEMKKCYINFWWEYLESRLIDTDYSRLLNSNSSVAFPADHLIYYPVQLDSNDEIKHERLNFVDTSNERIASSIETFSKEQHEYLKAWSKWFARDMSSDNLCPGDKCKLFYNRSVFFNDEYLDELEEAERHNVLEEQKKLFKEHLGYEVHD